MNPLHTIQICPVCHGSAFNFVFECKDYSISGEEFKIWECNNCTLRFTSPVPEEKRIGPYYQSENYISHSDTSKGFISKLYKLVRWFTLSEKRRLVQRLSGLAKGNLLDIGCGTGAFLNEMTEFGWDALGVEPDYGARLKAEELYKLNVLEPAHMFNLSPNQYDAVTLWHVAEHLYELEGYLKHIQSLLKSDGHLLIAVPNYTSYDGRHYQPFWAAYDVPRHLYHFSPKAIAVLSKKNGFKLVKTKRMWLDGFYISMLSEQYKNGKPGYLKAIFHGSVGLIQSVFNKSKTSSLIYILKKANS